MNKKKILKITIEVIVIIGIIVGFILINDQLSQNRKSTFEFIKDSNEYTYQIEETGYDGEDFYIKGWFFELKSVRNTVMEVGNNKTCGVVLYDMNKNIADETVKSDNRVEGIALNVEKIVRNDINDYFKCEYDYSNCGFVAKIPKIMVDVENSLYQIILKADEKDNNGIETAIFLDHGTLKYINPKDEVKLDVNGTDLEDIVNKGYCMVSDPGHYIYVYQYEKKLYWIADKDYYFENDGSTCIQFSMDTTQFDKLPKDRIDKGLYWSSIGDDFEKYEVTDTINCGKYRVSVREIPKDYSVTRIVTGYMFDEKWVWKGQFRPVFR
ncbi:MAG: hypothetical protein IKP88_02110 [Lachnospiraceae bacterium]|nr:hypothetical protein [Lachnospiraceae bacterium]